MVDFKLQEGKDCLSYVRIQCRMAKHVTQLSVIVTKYLRLREKALYGS
jgi:hypothetical protein